ncbi:MAG TPA: alpha/beta fold hydrolase [Verrucomicrobiae bacterium]|nr:alpha/beta fold hydrolase [Verrucomicrobiae bacterium]
MSKGNLSARNTRWLVAAASAVLILGVILSRVIEPGVRVEKVTLAQDTPALKFIPAGAGPHPVALLAHGYASSKEALFRYGEALAAAGFICYSVDQPGHGASPRPLTIMDAAHTLEAAAQQVGPVDVFLGWSMGGFSGGLAVRDGDMKPGLFIALGAMPVLGERGPPLLFLAGRFEEAFPPALLKSRKDARVVISPWSDHFLEGFDPVLVNAAVKAACEAVHRTPPASPTAWLWRLMGVALAMLAAGALAGGLTDLFSPLARYRGLLIGVYIAVAFLVTIGGRWFEAVPHWRLQVIAIPVILLIAIVAGRFRVPRWSFLALTLVATVIAVCWFRASGSRPALIFMAATVVLMPTLIAGMVIAWFASRRGSRLQGDIAMAIFLGCAPFQFLQLPRTAPQAPIPHTAIKLDAKLLDACIGEYEIVPDNVFGVGTKVTIRREGDRLVWKAIEESGTRDVLELYPESETNFFHNGGLMPRTVTFVKNEKGEATAIIHHLEGLGLGMPASEARRLKREK